MRIYVGNIAPGVSEEDLRKAFKAFGQVSFVNIVADRFNKNTERFGIIGMPESLEGEAAITGLHATDMKGKTLSVTEAGARTTRPPVAG
jgi:RNA recognition motif-containing protein